MTDAAFPTWGDTALVVLVPEAEPVVSGLRLVHDPVAEDGVPAHVTVLFPFVPSEHLTDTVDAAAGELFGRIPAFGLIAAANGHWSVTNHYPLGRQ